MYRKIKSTETSIKVNGSYVGETIEQKIERVTVNREPITDGAPIVYTERREGVRPEFDIRTDKFEIAIDAMDKVSKTKIAEREGRIGKIIELEKARKEQKNGGAEPIGGTSE